MKTTVEAIFVERERQYNRRFLYSPHAMAETLSAVKAS
jgi:hypothetical protein